MITITQTADEASRTKERPAYYDAAATVEGVTYTARARYGVVNAVARQLVEAGIPDGPVQSPYGRSTGVGWKIEYRSLHQMAERTVAEGPTQPVRGRKWSDPANAFAGLGSKPVSSQERVAGASEYPAAEQGHKTAVLQAEAVQ